MRRLIILVLMVPLLLGAYGELQPDGTYSIQGLWHLNDNSDPESDSSGNGNTGDIVNADYITTGKFGGAYYFDGGGERITISDDPVFDITQALTVMAWVKFDATVKWSHLVGKYSASAGREWLLCTGFASAGIYDQIEIDFGDPNNGTFEGSIVSDFEYTEGIWYLLAFTFDQGTVKLYIDAEDESFNITSGSIPGSLYNGTADVEIGGYVAASVYTHDGQIDEVAIWDRALTATEIRQLYAMQKGIYGVQ